MSFQLLLWTPENVNCENNVAAIRFQEQAMVNKYQPLNIY